MASCLLATITDDWPSNLNPGKLDFSLCGSSFAATGSMTVCTAGVGLRIMVDELLTVGGLVTEATDWVSTGNGFVTVAANSAGVGLGWAIIPWLATCDGAEDITLGLSPPRLKP